jgi:anthranilate/para-aminobenzoate synthase component II
MAIRHREMPVYGVQFHPESFLTVNGHEMLRSFLGTTSTGLAS